MAPNTYTPSHKSSSMFHMDAPQALAHVQQLYREQIEHLRAAMQRFVAGDTPPAPVRAFYPFVRVHTTTVARADNKLAYGFVEGPGRFETTLTRPDLFADYYAEQFRLLRTDLPKAKTLFEEARGKDEGTQYATALLEDGCPDRELLASAAASIEEARKNPKASPLLARSLARGYFHLGQAAKAAEAQKGFVAFAKGAGAPSEVMAELEKELATYLAAVK